MKPTARFRWLHTYVAVGHPAPIIYKDSQDIGTSHQVLQQWFESSNPYEKGEWRDVPLVFE